MPFRRGFRVKLKQWRKLLVLSGLMAAACVSSNSERTAVQNEVVPTRPPDSINPTQTLASITPTATSTQTAIPSPTLESEWTECSQHSFGTMLLCSRPDKCSGDWIRPVDVLVTANDQFGVEGVAATGAPSEFIRDDAFGKLPGWTRIFLRGTYESLENVHQAATIFGMEDMYECFGYGPESVHQAGEEALDPLTWVPKAEALADAASKCLVYGPAVRDYERMSTLEGEDLYRDELLSGLIAEVAPHVDIWTIQLAKYQVAADNGKDFDGNPYTIEDFESWIKDWVTWIKTSNQATAVWVQLGIGKNIPGQGCQPPQPPEYILEYREILIRAGVDGMFVMPAMPCQYSEIPQDHEYYLQTLAVFQEAIQLACERPT